MRVGWMTFVTAIALLAGRVSYAQETATAPAIAPAAAPTTAPAVVPADTTTPRGALKILLLAMQKGDAAQIRAMINAQNPTEQAMVDAMAHRAEVETSFRAAAIKAFGAAEAKLLVGDSEAAGAEASLQIDASEEKITGDSAVVSNAAGAPPLTLKKVNGAWAVPAGEFAKDTDAKVVEQRLDDMEFASSLIGQYATDVAAGKYKTAQEAGEAIKNNMMVAMMKRSTTRQAVPEGMEAPTTGPATAPATQP